MFKTILASLLMIAFGYAISTGVHRWHDNATAKEILGATVIEVCGQYTGTVVIHRDGTQFGVSKDQAPIEQLMPLFRSLDTGDKNPAHNRVNTVSVPCMEAMDPTQAMPGDLPDDKSV